MSEWTEEGARRTEGPADAGGMPANKTRTPHRDVGNKSCVCSNTRVLRCVRTHWPKQLELNWLEHSGCLIANCCASRPVRGVAKLQWISAHYATTRPSEGAAVDHNRPRSTPLPSALKLHHHLARSHLPTPLLLSPEVVLQRRQSSF